MNSLIHQSTRNDSDWSGTAHEDPHCDNDNDEQGIYCAALVRKVVSGCCLLYDFFYADSMNHPVSLSLPLFLWLSANTPGSGEEGQSDC